VKLFLEKYHLEAAAAAYQFKVEMTLRQERLVHVISGLQWINRFNAFLDRVRKSISNRSPKISTTMPILMTKNQLNNLSATTTFCTRYSSAHITITTSLPAIVFSCGKVVDEFTFTNTWNALHNTAAIACWAGHQY
jgi:hypothetical protein